MQSFAANVPHALNEVCPKSPPQVVESKNVGRGDAQRLAAWLHPHAAAEPDLKTILADLRGQRSLHGRYDLPIVPYHVLAPPARTLSAPIRP
jgi:hypothetical protein